MPGSPVRFANDSLWLKRLLYVFTAFLFSACILIPATLTVGAESTANTQGFSVPLPERLGGKDRSLVFLSTDKPIYKPGETVYARVVALQAGTYFPVRTEHGQVRLHITGPRKNEVADIRTLLSDSTAGFSWTIPQETAGGRYEASVTLGGSPASVRPFEVRVYAPPRLKSQIVFVREGYGPGDTVTASAHIERAEGGTPVGARVTAVARIDGIEAARVENLTIDAEGNCGVSFTLPNTLERGEGTLAFLIEDGGVVETATKTIPILLQTMDIAFYPEGGDMIAGLPARVYVQARRPDGKPADIRGEVIRVDAQNNPLAATGEQSVTGITTVHEGRGVMEFTPQEQERYALRLLQPSGINRLFPLPPAQASGVTIRAAKATYAFDDAITLTVQSRQGSAAGKVTLFQRERLLDQADVTAQTVTLNPGDAEGVLIATVWDKEGKPLAERLIFREPKFAVQVGITVEPLPAGASPTPGGKVRLTLETRDKKGQPVEAVVGVSVTDDALLEMVEKRDQAPSLPVMVYLENEVKDLADAQVYFDASNPEAGRDVDLLLGTQGWRRFILARLDEALKANPDGVRRALAMHIVIPPVAAHPEMFRREKMAENHMMAVPAPVPAMEVDEGGIIEDLKQMEQAEDILAEDKAIPADARVMGDVMLDAEPHAENAKKPAPYIAIREYAHTVRPNRRPNDRVDFTETLYWNAGIRTNPRDGRAVVEFALSDSVTTFRARADAFGNNGALGAASAGLASLEPFYLEPKLPPVVVTGDRVDCPVALINSTGQRLDTPGLTIQSAGVKTGMPTMPNALEQGSRDRVLVRLEPEKSGNYTVKLSAAAGGYTDSVTRPLMVLPRGFPVQQTASGLLGPQKSFTRQFTIAGDIASGSLRADIKIYPTPLAGMEEALNALLKQPYGCFEQTSSTSYPLVMAQQYFMSHTGIAPEKIKKADALLAQSYKRLAGFESPAKGYEWFGSDPGHEALTAYGLMQFNEMKKVMPVDEAMLERTRAWLLSRRDGDGGFQRNQKALDSFGGAPTPLTNLYIIWTLLESGEKAATLQSEIAAAKKLAAETKDPYLLALAANILVLADDKTAAQAAASTLQGLQGKDGSLAGAETTITRSGGDALLIETTSLTVLAWLRCGDSYAGSVERAMAWLFERCKAGRFGSTQSTILALKAINAYDAARAHPKAPGSVQLVIDGKPFGHPAVFDEKSRGALELPDFAAALAPGVHLIELSMTGGGDMPFALEIAYNTPQPASSAECPLILSTALSTHKVQEGEPVDLAITLKVKNADVPMPIAVIGLPAGLEPRHERLKEMVAAGQIAAYEILGRDLVLYWRKLQAGPHIELSIPLTAQTPGSYTAPASRAYAFYLDEHKHWVAGEEIEILPR